MALTYGDLPDSGNPNITCDNDDCDDWHVLYSATRGDYWMVTDVTPVTCAGCHEPMFLAREITAVVIQVDDQ